MTRQDGKLGLLYDGEAQHAVLGPILNSDLEKKIERAFVLTPGSPVPVAGTSARPVGNVFATAEAVSADVREVIIETACGDAPAWLFPGTDDDASTWAIHIHGSLSGREGAFRTVNSLKSAGVTSLVPSIRGDGDGPPAPRGAFTLGQTEWHDIDNAVDYAVNHGAHRILLVGWSSGASMALRLAASSKHRDIIDGLILISPVISWRNSIMHNSAHFGVPGVIAIAAVDALAFKPTSRLFGLSQPLQFPQLDWLLNKPALLPMLIFHSEGDRTAPFRDSDRFATIARRSVELMRLPSTGHALEWNFDSAAFEQKVTEWLPEVQRQRGADFKPEFDTRAGQSDSES
ncbi:alpha/beta hydrolase family protein [Subtercola boreus]|nr:alpha/beta fold hydrolase [Subtercola boreus]